MVKTNESTRPAISESSTMDAIKRQHDLIARHAAECEANGRIAEPVLAALRETGLFRMTAARRAGGQGATIREQVECVAEIAKACPGTAWAAGILSASTGMAASLPGLRNRALFRSGDELVCFVASKTGVARPTEGGYVVTGEWPYASGSLHASWALCGVKLAGPDGETTGFATAFIDLAAPEVEVLLDWDVSGLSGSGSNRVKATEHFVPAELVLLPTDRNGPPQPPSSGEDEARDRWPEEVQTPLSVLPSMLGAAQGLLAAVHSKMTERPVINWRYERQSDSQLLLAMLGEASLKIDSAWMHVHRVCDVVDLVAPVRSVTPMEKVRAQADCGYAMRLLREAGALLMDIAGPGGFASANPAQRFWRDINIGTRHNALNAGLSIELLGRAMTGQESNSLFISRF